MVKSRKKIGLNTEKEYFEWCRKIAETRDEPELISHFRKHVYGHFNRHEREGELGLRIWLVGVFNFLHIFRQKYKKITTEDMLFKLCSYYKDYEKGPKPLFNIDKFMKEYESDMKDYYYKYQAKQKA